MARVPRIRFLGTASTSVTQEDLVVSVGTLTLTGQSVTLKSARKLVVSVGTLALSGQSVTQKTDRKLIVSVGTLTLSGREITLTKNVTGESSFLVFSEILIREPRLMIPNQLPISVKYLVELPGLVLAILPTAALNAPCDLVNGLKCHTNTALVRASSKGLIWTYNDTSTYSRIFKTSKLKLGTAITHVSQYRMTVGNDYSALLNDRDDYNGVCNYSLEAGQANPFQTYPRWYYRYGGTYHVNSIGVNGSAALNEWHNIGFSYIYGVPGSVCWSLDGKTITDHSWIEGTGLDSSQTNEVDINLAHTINVSNSIAQNFVGDLGLQLLFDRALSQVELDRLTKNITLVLT